MGKIQKTIPAGQFKVRCLQVLDEVRRKREPVVITKRGVPVARLVPVDGQREDVFGCLADRIEVLGDVVEPVTQPGEWDVLR